VRERILILGSGGREHALVRHLKSHQHEVFAWPGSDAISQEAKILAASDLHSLKTACQKESIKNIIVGPEQYLFEAFADELSSAGFFVFGPKKEVAQLETDKAYAKEFFFENKIPTARSQTVKSLEEAKTALNQFTAPYVVKASGLAQGKGVWIGTSKSEALKTAQEFLISHESLVIEEFLAGVEVSCFYLVDGENYEFLGTAQDHKRLLNDDQGPNTGGMGAISPSPLENPKLLSQIEKEVLLPTLMGLRKRNLSYRGFLFLGLMLVKEKPYVLEYNCRMGDPETQCLLQRLKSDLWQSISDLNSNKTGGIQLSKEPAVTVVVAAKGYPTQPIKGTSLGQNLEASDLQILHSGTKLNNEKSWMANGGRLFTVNGSGPFKQARQRIYEWIRNWQKSLGAEQNKVIYRSDIGAKYE